MSVKISTNQTLIAKTVSEIIQDSAPECEKIEALWAKGLDLIQKGGSATDSVEILVALGVGKQDVEAQNTCFDLMKKVHKEALKILKMPSEDLFSGGVFLVTGDQDKKIAALKTGSQAATMSLGLRELADLLNLRDHAIPGLFCHFTSPALSAKDLEGITEPLWNGGEKEYHLEKSVKTAPFSFIGQMGPFLTSDATTTAPLDLNIVLLALATGLVDVKDDGLITINRKVISIDNADWALDNSSDDHIKHRCASIDFPFLKSYDRETKSPLDQNDIDLLKAITKKWSIDSIQKYLEEMPIRFPDVEAEKAKWDEEFTIGKNKSSVICEPVKTKGQAPIDVSKVSKMLTKNQVQFVVERLTKLQDFIEKATQPFSVYELAWAVDPVFKHQCAVQEEERNKEREAPPSGRLSRKLDTPTWAWAYHNSSSQMFPTESRENSPPFTSLKTPSLEPV